MGGEHQQMGEKQATGMAQRELEFVDSPRTPKLAVVDGTGSAECASDSVEVAVLVPGDKG